ncbi:MAG: redoxin domain-containing protein [Anaerolineae bacterium]|nr:redoxin domain-containing protein [Anaerolineales bacterium]MCB8935323.1 redoxin domain-containing protein [Promineifilum sp.]MCW5846571.1 redoxin domain-containing protein [Anaerolineae bacterium]
MDVETFFLELGLTFQTLLDEGGATGRNYGLANTLPSTVVINPEGEIVATHRGSITHDQLDLYLSEALQ